MKNIKHKKQGICVQNPVFIFDDQKRNFNGYNFKFVEKYCDSIYLYARPWHYLKYKKKLKELGWNKKLYLTLAGINKNTNILICFNGCPFEKRNSPNARYSGLKIFHIMDYSNNVKKIDEIFRKNKVDYVMSYSHADRYSDFFKKYLPAYINKVISVPFGYSDRFKCERTFSDRIPKAIALGSVNPVNDPLMDNTNLKDYIEFYKGHKFSHEVRKYIVDNIEELNIAIDSKLPIFPETKNPDYDAVYELNKYMMFINDASIDRFPPARTYEGIACGCVMVAENLPIYSDIGFVNDYNCILFEPGNYKDMYDKICYYKNHLEELYTIHKKSLELANNYSHDKVAEKLYRDIIKLT